MNVFGLTITRTKALREQLQAVSVSASSWLSSWTTSQGWFPVVRESFPGAWQRNVELGLENILHHPTVYACVTLIAQDVAKMRIRLVEQDADGIWSEVESPSFSPVLRKPNHYQDRIGFFEHWMLSKLIHGNTYVLKQRDQRRLVTGLYVLDPSRVRPMVAPDGDVLYELKRDDLSLQPDEVVYVPASEIIHDMMPALYHPLVGISPLVAIWLLATQGLKVEEQSSEALSNAAMAGGFLLVPGPIKQEQADRLKMAWESNYSGAGFGKVAVLGDNMKFEPNKTMMSAVDAQVVEQLARWDDRICSVFHVPPYKVGVGPAPNYNNIEALAVEYFVTCLQTHIEKIELRLDEGMGLAPDKVEGRRLGTEFDLDDLLRMDSNAMVGMLEKGKNYFTPNDGRRKLGLKPVKGGDDVYRQQQDFSLQALQKRDAQADPFAKKPTTAPAAPEPPKPAPADAPKHLTASEATEMGQQKLRQKLMAA